MEKYLLTFEFRYTGMNKHKDDYRDYSKTITMGIYDTITEAVNFGNECLPILAETFEIGRNDRFKVSGLFGAPDTLVTNTCYKDKVHFFGKITTLNFTPLKEMITESIESRKQYDEYIRNEDN